jgi:hypothetical protein
MDIMYKNVFGKTTTFEKGAQREKEKSKKITREKYFRNKLTNKRIKLKRKLPNFTGKIGKKSETLGKYGILNTAYIARRGESVQSTLCTDSCMCNMRRGSDESKNKLFLLDF